MAKKKKGKFSHNGGVSLDFYGFQELLEKITKVGGNLEDALSKSLQASAKPIENDLREFMNKHHKTGDTIGSFENIHSVDRVGGYVYYKLGFNKDNGGLPALYLDVGTPTIKPSFFVYYAFTNNADRVKQEQEQALLKILEDLM